MSEPPKSTAVPGTGHRVPDVRHTSPSTRQSARRGAERALRQVGAVFFKLGLIGFGGPAAHIALMEDEIVRRRGWLSRSEFLDLVGATQLIPGPNSTELALHIGRCRAGWRGLVVAGLTFILPAALMVFFLAVLYRESGRLPVVADVLAGVKPVMIAVVIVALWRLKDLIVRNLETGAIFVASVVAAFVWPLHELEVLFAAVCGSLALGWRRTSRPPTLPAMWMPAGMAVGYGFAGMNTLPALFLVFLKAGSILFGSGYVLLAFLRADVVVRFGWLTEGQLLDAIAVGQMTPGPVFTTATFVGYLVAGGWGAVVATVGIFVPAFVFVAVTGPLLPRLRSSPVLSVMLDGVNAASIALMAVVTWQLGRAAVVDGVTAAIAAGALMLLLGGVNAAWIVAAGALAGWWWL